MLGQIGAVHDQIRGQNMDLDRATALVTERLVQFAHAGGAALCLIDGLNVRYRAAHGQMTLPAGTELPMEKALCSASLRAGQVIRCSNLNAEFLLDVEECQRRGIRAIIAVPIYHQGSIAGGLEVYFASVQNFTDQGVHCCQLMAGIITDFLGRKEPAPPKKLPASERAAVLEVLEKLKPSLAALAEAPAARGATVSAGAIASPVSVSAAACRKCSNPLMPQEQFCGKCGTPRVAGYEPPALRSQAVAKLPEVPADLQIAQLNGVPEHTLPPIDPLAPERPLADSIEEELPELFADPALRLDKMPPPPNFETALAKEHEHNLPAALDKAPVEADAEAEPLPEAAAETPEAAAETALVKPEPTQNWSSASSARQFLEDLARNNRAGGFANFWQNRRGDVYLAIAVVLVLVVIRWGIWSNHSVVAQGKPSAAATTTHKPSPDADLSLWDRTLISLGLAEAPPVPEYKGNPDTQVWIDLHTALYYCPGADLYGKTPKGRFTTQHEAQLDQFESASRRACE